jgi:hypothetical protein
MNIKVSEEHTAPIFKIVIIMNQPTQCHNPEDHNELSLHENSALYTFWKCETLLSFQNLKGQDFHAVTIHAVVFWAIILCNIVHDYQSFRRTYYLLL